MLDRWQSAPARHMDVSRTLRGLEAALTLTPSPREEHFQHPQKRDPGQSLQCPQSTVPSWTAWGSLLHSLNHKHLTMDNKSPPSCAYLGWDQRLRSQPILSLLKGKREYLSPTICSTLQIENTNKKGETEQTLNHQEPPASPNPLQQVFLFHNLHVRLQYRKTIVQEKFSNLLKVPKAQEGKDTLRRG